MKKTIENMKKVLNEMSIPSAPKKRSLMVENFVYDDESEYEEGLTDDTEDVVREPEMAKSNGVDIKSIIKSIRLQVLNGLAKIADHPESDEYEVLKRLLTICDKPMEKQSNNIDKN